jgi:hypothetical protein
VLTPQFVLPLARELVVDLFAGGGGASTGIVVNVSWADRFRLLVSGKCRLEVRHRADVLVTRIQSRSQFNVEPPRALE